MLRLRVFVDVVLVSKPLPSCGVNGSQSAAKLQVVGSILGSLFHGHGTCRSVSRRSSEEGYLRLEGSNDGGVNLAALQIAEGTVVLGIGSTKLQELVQLKRRQTW